jgi:hypothetical protein
MKKRIKIEGDNWVRAANGALEGVHCRELIERVTYEAASMNEWRTDKLNLLKAGCGRGG